MKFIPYLLPLLFFASSLQADEIKLHGAIHADRDISAAAFFGDKLLIGSDEAVGDGKNENYIQLLERNGDNYQISHDILIYRGGNQQGHELDIEGVAVEGQRIYVTGSHALVRKRIKPDKSDQKNLIRLATIKAEPARKQIFRITLNSNLELVDRTSISLADIIANDPILSPFAAIPSKENGIDIEGIAVKDGLTYLGFRGPVLRDGFVPVLQLKFDQPEKHYRLYWLNLGGLGIRDMTAVGDGFLILAGPVAEVPNDYRLYHWNGNDSLADHKNLKQLLQINPSEGGSKPEAVAIELETEHHYRILLLHDGIKGGSPKRYTIPR